jgi:hypothetical protein
MYQITKNSPQLKDPCFAFKCITPVSNQCNFGQYYAMGVALWYGVTLVAFCIMGLHWDNPAKHIQDHRKMRTTMNVTKKEMNSSVLHHSHPGKPLKLNCTAPNTTQSSNMLGLNLFDSIYLVTITAHMRCSFLSTSTWKKHHQCVELSGAWINWLLNWMAVDYYIREWIIFCIFN